MTVIMRLCDTRAYLRPLLTSQGKGIMTGTPQVASHVSA